jgi:hypothetical protein
VIVRIRVSAGVVVDEQKIWRNAPMSEIVLQSWNLSLFQAFGLFLVTAASAQLILGCYQPKCPARGAFTHCAIDL